MRRQMIIVLLVPLLLFVLPAGYLDYEEWHTHLPAAARQAAERDVLTIAVSAAKDVHYNNYFELWQYLDTLAGNDPEPASRHLLGQKSLAILSPGGLLLAHSAPASHPLMQTYKGPLPRRLAANPAGIMKETRVFTEVDNTRARLLAYAPVVYDGTTVAGVVVEYDLQPLYVAQEKVLDGLIYRAVLAVLAAVLFSLLLARWITRPLNVLVENLPGLGNGGFQVAALSARRDEFRTLADALVEADARIHAANASLQDEIAERQRAQRALSLAATVFENSSEGIVIADASNNIISVNRAFERLTGYSAQDVIGKNPRVLKSGRHDREFYREMWDMLKREGRWQGEIWDRRKDGTTYPKMLTINSVKDEHGAVINYIAIFSDITERKVSEERIHYLAHHDPLTGLANRALLGERIRDAIHRARRSGNMVALMFVDLDRFKIINDTLGHDVGDSMLCQVAERLRELVRGSDTVARLGGDEFVVLLTDIVHGEDTARVAEKLVAALGRPYFAGGQELRSAGSVGIGLYPQDGEDEHALIRSADTAMYHAKGSGGGGFQFYTPAMHQQVVERLALERGLRQALEAEQLTIEYQPQVNVRTGRFEAFEALLRWPRQEQGRISPSTFIPVAEESGLIIPTGEWVLRRACEQVVEWHKAGWRDLRVAVNVSARQLWREGFSELVAHVLEEQGLDARYLELELTESALLRQQSGGKNELQELRALGVQIAIDDFGTGYSSLGYLKRLAVDRLKIDQSFVRGIEHDADSRAIVIAIIKMAETLGIALVAEGVETPQARDFLCEQGCEVMQGFLLGYPQLAAAWREPFCHESLYLDGLPPPGQPVNIYPAS